MSKDLPIDRILTYLELEREQPSYDYLRRLLLAHRERVPHETASRLLRCRDMSEPDDRLCLPIQVWEESIALGTGTTCSDGTYAFKKLLEGLGFDVSLAINSEGKIERSKTDELLTFPRNRSHCSVVVQLDGQRYVADPCSIHIVKVPLPIGLPYRVDVSGRTDEGRRYHYAVEPLNDGYYELHNVGLDAINLVAGDSTKGRPPRGQMYIFHDKPISDEEFEEHMRFGYRKGYASNRLSFFCRDRDTKIEYRFNTRSGRLWRSIEGPWEQIPLGTDPAQTLTTVSGLPYDRISQALVYLQSEYQISIAEDA
ncbi:MAG: arylamine N-acetyltransferase [Chloroflexota bacterium]